MSGGKKKTGVTISCTSSWKQSTIFVCTSGKKERMLSWLEESTWANNNNFCNWQETTTTKTAINLCSTAMQVCRRAQMVGKITKTTIMQVGKTKNRSINQPVQHGRNKKL